MERFATDAAFWRALESLVESCKLVLDRPAGTAHPRYPGLVYPVAYGYLESTASMDGDGMDVWKGTGGDRLEGLVATVDLVKKDSEIKLLIGCTVEETGEILRFHNASDFQKGILIRRE